MWYNNKKIIRIHNKNASKMTWAFIDGINGWQRIKTTSVDGVNNITIILSTALANSRTVDVYIDNGYIEQATLR